MARAILVNKAGSHTIEDIDNVLAPRANLPYWEISRSALVDGKKTLIRSFYHIDNVTTLEVEGEEELIEKAKTPPSNTTFMNEILG